MWLQGLTVLIGLLNRWCLECHYLPIPALPQSPEKLHPEGSALPPARTHPDLQVVTVWPRIGPALRSLVSGGPWVLCLLTCTLAHAMLSWWPCVGCCPLFLTCTPAEIQLPTPAHWLCCWESSTLCAHCLRCLPSVQRNRAMLWFAWAPSNFTFVGHFLHRKIVKNILLLVYYYILNYIWK